MPLLNPNPNIAQPRRMLAAMACAQPSKQWPCCALAPLLQRPSSSSQVALHPLDGLAQGAFPNKLLGQPCPRHALQRVLGRTPLAGSCTQQSPGSSPCPSTVANPSYILWHPHACCSAPVSSSAPSSCTTGLPTVFVLLACCWRQPRDLVQRWKPP
jgi:hypothetical protein